MVTQPPVLAGINHSPESAVIAELAAAEALRRRAPLTLLGCRPDVRAVPRALPVGGRGTTVRATGTDRAVEAVRAAYPYLELTLAMCPGELADALVERSRQASLVVVDARHTGGRDAVLGRWLPNRVITHSHCPVLVVGTRASAIATAATRLPVLVGVDGSAHGRAAIGRAFDAAAQRQVPLRAVRVHCVNPRAAPYATGGGGYVASDAPARAAELVADSLSEWADRYPHVEIITEPMYAPDAASALVDATAAADLVVVGARGRTAITSLLLGSVSRALVEYAHCPVLVTHAWN